MTAQRNRIGASDLDVFPLALGGNVFGWTADTAESFNVLDSYAEAGGNFVDTADSYSFWAPGNEGGESELILGQWMKSRGNRSDIVVATKVSQHPRYRGMAPSTVAAGAEASLSRLNIDVIDLYYAHFDDSDSPLEESAAAMSALVDQGKVRYIGISNYSPERIRRWLDICRENGLHSPVALQPQYSLMERGIEYDLLPLAEQAKLGVMPYYSLARGFLTGKYRSGEPVNSPRAGAAQAYLDGRGEKVMDALETVSRAHGVAPATVALAWLAAQPTVTAPIASARNLEQLTALVAHADLRLFPEELALLDDASRLH
ncbi:aryl-alcohol dehydrogenase-like predicted oxidoreductase [Arthrobacter sp. 1088]|uniref:aldo/keto reductase n=1 Tax=Arthrobacter sp. 1088 TaxID=2817768 RepID=UPI0028644376|nr:aldo/keto reductase [Arthrobacter sp. 1088]MDR6688641.1 aryl-alcohol dehydrogenase-like predicted oxidoreductase [Arthrobacter sp. 1088]